MPSHDTQRNVTPIFKIESRSIWSRAVDTGLYRGSDHDIRDGFIHFSTGEQLPETARKHFSGFEDLMLIAVDGAALGPALRWEPSRGGALFPHLYAPLETRHAIWTALLPLADDSVPDVARAMRPAARIDTAQE